MIRSAMWKLKHVQRQVLLEDLRRDERAGRLDALVLEAGKSFLEWDGHVEIGVH